MPKSKYTKQLDANQVPTKDAANRLFKRYAERNGLVLEDVVDHIISSNKWVGHFNQKKEPIYDRAEFSRASTSSQG